jgi:hypothetical protein
MTLTPLSIALQGIGYGALPVAVHGFLGTTLPPSPPTPSVGRGFVAEKPRKKRDDDEVLLLLM